MVSHSRRGLGSVVWTAARPVGVFPARGPPPSLAQARGPRGKASSQGWDERGRSPTPSPSPQGEGARFKVALPAEALSTLAFSKWHLLRCSFSLRSSCDKVLSPPRRGKTWSQEDRSGPMAALSETRRRAVWRPPPLGLRCLPSRSRSCQRATLCCGAAGNAGAMES